MFSVQIKSLIDYYEMTDITTLFIICPDTARTVAMQLENGNPVEYAVMISIQYRLKDKLNIVIS